jgi:hypothetical protein
VTDIAWIDAALTSARPQALGALLRYFHDLDMAEKAFLALDEEAARKSEDTADNPQAAIEKKQRSEILRRCWSRLSPQHRDIIDLVYYQEKAIPQGRGNRRRAREHREGAHVLRAQAPCGIAQRRGLGSSLIA